MQAHYEINVSKNGYHFFATAPRSIITERDFEEAAKIFKEKFPESEGYQVSAIYWEGKGKSIAI